MHGDSLGYTDGKVHGCDEGKKMGSADVKFLGTIPVNVDGIILGLNVGTYLGSVYGSFDGSNDGRLEGLFLVGSRGYTDCKLLDTILGFYMESHLGLMLEQIWDL